MKKYYLINNAIIACLLFTFSLFNAQAADSPWPMYQHDARHTGRSQYIGPLSNTVKWTWDLPNGSAISSPIIGNDGTIYIVLREGGTHTGSLYAISSDGSFKWKSPTFSISGYCCWAGMLSPAIGSDGTVYVGGSGGSAIIYALNPDGSIKWTFVPGGTFPYGHFNTGPHITIGSDEMLYVTAGLLSSGANQGYVFSLDQDGNLEWLYSTNHGDHGWHSPALAQDGTIFATSTTGYTNLGWLEAIDTPGVLKWLSYFGIGSGEISSPSIGPDGTVYVDANYFRAFDPTDGNILYANMTGSNPQIPVIAPDGSIIVSVTNSDSPSEIKIFYPNGSVKTTFPLETNAKPLQAIVDVEGTIYVGVDPPESGLSAEVLAIKSDSTLKWNYTTPVGYSFIDSPPAIGSDGTLYISIYDEGSTKLYAFGSANQFPIIDSFEADPTSGEPPLAVNFTCVAHDDDGWIESYTIDYGDGSDLETNDTGLFTKTYENIGNYQATCSAMDNEDASTTSDPLTIKAIRIPVLIVPGILGSWSTDLFNDKLLFAKDAEQFIEAYIKTEFDEDIDFDISEEWVLIPKVYDLLKDELQIAGFITIDVPYDWRLRNSLSANECLIPAIDQVKQTYGVSKVNVVAHSMGGLVVRWYIQSSLYNDRQDINKFIMLGTPNHGSVDAYYAWEGGELISDSFWGGFGKEIILDDIKKAYGLGILPDVDFIQGYILSIRELMPTYRFLINQSTGRFVRMKRENRNLFLSNLNRRLRRLIRSGVVIQSFAGTGLVTLMGLSVVPQSPADKLISENLWEDGKPVDETKAITGDGVVLTNSVKLRRIPHQIKVGVKHSHLPDEFAYEIVDFLSEPLPVALTQ